MTERIKEMHNYTRPKKRKIIHIHTYEEKHIHASKNARTHKHGNIQLEH